MAFKPVKTRKIYLEIVNQIKESIEKGELKPGDKLPSEMDLAGQFNASRASLREALSALEIIGIIEGRRGDGNYIKANIDNITYLMHFNELTAELSPFEILEARKSIEPSIVKLAAEKRIPEYVIKMEELLKQMPDALKAGRWRDINTEFHLLVAKAADNVILFETMKYIVETMRSFVLWKHIEDKATLDGESNADEFVYYKDHVKLVEAIKQGNGDKAVRIMQNHIEDTERDFLDKG